MSGRWPTDRDPDCLRCVHYRVTWDAAAPCGCAFFGFKSRRKPSQVVLDCSGRPCAEFRAQRRRAGRAASRRGQA